MGFFSSKPATQTVVQSPWEPQQKHLISVFDAGKDWFDQGGADLYEGPMTAQRDPLEFQGEQNLLGYVGGDQYGGMSNAAHSATQGILGDPYGGQDYSNLTSNPAQYGFTSANVNPGMDRLLSGNPFANPYTKQVADSIEQDMVESYGRDIAPQLRSAQIAYQPGGSSRGDMVNARAEDDLQENLINMRAGFYNDAYNRALNDQALGVQLGLGQEQLGEQARQARAGEGISRYGAGVSAIPALTSNELQALAVPGLIGENRRAYDQSTIDEDVFRHNFDQERLLRTAQDYLGLVSGNYGGTSTGTYKPAEASPFMQMIQGVQAGASIGSAFGPWGAAIGGVAGGAIGGFA